MSDGTLIKEVERIAREAQAIKDRVDVIGGESFSTTPLHHVAPPREPCPEPIKATTLSAVAEYIRVNRDALDFTKLMIIIDSPTKVSITGALRGWHQQRFTYFTASPDLPSRFAFGEFVDLEKAKIGLLSMFEETEDRDELIRMLGNVVVRNSVRAEDDGASQSVTVKGGIKLMQDVKLPLTWRLAPFRTFSEVPQPASAFLLRLKEFGEGDVRVALFEADGGAWRREAAKRVQRWLRMEFGTGDLSEIPVIG